MTAKAKYKSDAFEAIHSAAQGLYRAGTIDKATMREFDQSCLDKIPEAPSILRLPAVGSMSRRRQQP